MKRWFVAVTLFASPGFSQELPTKAECLDAYTQSQPLRRDGKLGEARKALLLCARDPCPKQLQADCVGWLEEIDKAIPSIVLRARDATGRDLTDVSVFLDGQPLVTKLDGRALEIDPGSHVLRFVHDKSEVSQTLVIEEGDKHRRFSATFPTKDRPRSLPQKDETTPTSGPPPTLAYALGGLGIVALGSFAYFGATGLSDRSDLDSCKPNCATDDVKSVDRKFWIANISLAVAAISLGGATYLFLSSSGPRTAVGFRTSY